MSTYFISNSQTQYATNWRAPLELRITIPRWAPLTGLQFALGLKGSTPWTPLLKNTRIEGKWPGRRTLIVQFPALGEHP